MSINSDKLRNPWLRAWADANLSYASRTYAVGAPVLADVDRIVTIANMKNTTSYTIAAQPDVPRNISITHATVAAGTDTLGTITILGTNILDQVISEVITPSADTIVYGVKAFKTVVSAIGAGWIIAGGNDTILIGVGTALGIPIQITAASQVLYGILGTAIIDPTVAHTDTDIAQCTVDISSGTYNGTKKAFVVIVE